MSETRPPPTAVWLRSPDDRFELALDRLDERDRLRFEAVLEAFHRLAQGHEPIFGALCGLVMAEYALLMIPERKAPLDHVQMRSLKVFAVEVAERMAFERRPPP